MTPDAIRERMHQLRIHMEETSCRKENCLTELLDLIKTLDELCKDGKLPRAWMGAEPPIAPECAGSGTRWGTGTGAPICRVCHRGPISLGVRRPRRRGMFYEGTLPPHPRRVA